MPLSSGQRHLCIRLSQGRMQRRRGRRAGWDSVEPEVRNLAKSGLGSREGKDLAELRLDSAVIGRRKRTRRRGGADDRGGDRAIHSVARGGARCGADHADKLSMGARSAKDRARRVRSVVAEVEARHSAVPASVPTGGGLPSACEEILDFTCGAGAPRSARPLFVSSPMCSSSPRRKSSGGARAATS